MLAEMAWAERTYSIEEVDEAGRVLNDPSLFYTSRYDHTLTVIGNWRSSHGFPLNTFQIGLRNRAHLIDPDSIVVQRTKRFPAIYAKLGRFKWLTLSEMQDIGGCRAVVSSVPRVRQLVQAHLDSSFKHTLVDHDDYIQSPKPSGYRGYHLIYRYYSDKKVTYNGLKIEIQIRSKLQHAWATAVETVGTFTQQALKSSQGEKEWLRFFSLMGCEIALREKTPLVPGTSENYVELIEELREYANRLKVEETLKTYQTALRVLSQPGLQGSRYFLLKLEPKEMRIMITGYSFRELNQADADYLRIEREIMEGSSADAVLVSADSLAALHRGYTNYYLDTQLFLNELRRALAQRHPRSRRARRTRP